MSAIEQTAGEPVACRCGKCLGLVDVDLSDKAHPRPRVGVTEAMVDAFLSAYAKCELYNGWTFTHRMGVRAGIRAALADSPAPGVVELNEWRVVAKDGGRVPFLQAFPSATQAQKCCPEQDTRWPEFAPHRVMRVCLAPLANGGGEVARA